MLKCKLCGSVHGNYDGLMWHYERDHWEAYQAIKRRLSEYTEEIRYLDALVHEGHRTPQNVSIRGGRVMPCLGQE